MTNITIYTRAMCGYCARAKRFLDAKGLTYNEIDAGMNKTARAEMIQRSNGGSTFPQIFIGDTHIGGCDDMLAMDRRDQFDLLVRNESAG